MASYFIDGKRKASGNGKPVSRPTPKRSSSGTRPRPSAGATRPARPAKPGPKRPTNGKRPRPSAGATRPTRPTKPSRTKKKTTSLAGKLKSSKKKSIASVKKDLYSRTPKKSERSAEGKRPAPKKPMKMTITRDNKKRGSLKDAARNAKKYKASIDTTKAPTEKPKSKPKSQKKLNLKKALRQHKRSVKKETRSAKRDAVKSARSTHKQTMQEKRKQLKEGGKGLKGKERRDYNTKKRAELKATREKGRSSIKSARKADYTPKSAMYYNGKKVA